MEGIFNIYFKSIPLHLPAAEGCIKTAYQINITVEQLDYGAHNMNVVAEEIKSRLCELMEGNLYNSDAGDYQKKRPKYQLSPSYLRQLEAQQKTKEADREAKMASLKEEATEAPQELLDVVSAVKLSKPYDQYLKGNEKAINACVGLVMKQYKYDAAIIRQLLEDN